MKHGVRRFKCMDGYPSAAYSKVEMFQSYETDRDRPFCRGWRPQPRL